MKNSRCVGLGGRNELEKRLIQSYQEGYAEQFVLLTGLPGSGKSYVMNSVVKGLKKGVSHSINVYINRGDAFVPAYSSLMPNISEITFSIGTPAVTVGGGVGLQSNDSQYQYVRRILKKGLKTDVLLCVEDFSNAVSTIKSFTRIIAENLPALEEEFNKKIYFLLADSNADSFNSYISNLLPYIEHITMQPYVEKDIIEYLKKKHSSILVTGEFQKNIEQIQKISHGNLALVDFLFVDIQIQNNEYFDALEKVVNHRLAQLKSSGQKNNINETDMEDIILSSALCLQKFTPIDISKVTQRDGNIVSNSLDMAKKQVFIDKDKDCFYEFHCAEIQTVLRKQGINERKERLLYYYRYYTETEQDEYYFRGYYLAIYAGMLTSQAFALLGLAYVSAQRLSDYDMFKRIDGLIEKFADGRQRDQFKDIQKFYELLARPDATADDVYHEYKNLKLLNIELPLMGELARACFHFIYVSCPFDHMYLKTLMDECLQYAQNELALSYFSNPIGLKPADETIIRLTIIYEIAPCLLDVINDYAEFNKLYSLSQQFSVGVGTKGEKGLAQYIQNVFNRKAFLFVNQTQCEIYYEKAKKYFYDNQIWEEYCITLICQAGTNIVIQKYKEAQEYCDLAVEIAEKERIALPQPAKIKNNLFIAQFLEFEQKTQNQTKCDTKAKKTIRLLSKELQGVPCATEFVILTNICSLCLYCSHHDNYLKYKHKAEKLMGCADVSDITDQGVDDFYRYYFAWFEAYRAMCDGRWEAAEKLARGIDGLVPALFKKQEIFWERKNAALQALIVAKKIPSAHDFCNSLVQTERRETLLAKFFFRGLMLSDLQYTSYQ